MMMLSPKKRKARKTIETKVPPKKLKSETLVTQKSNDQDESKNVGTSRDLHKRIETIPSIVLNIPTTEREAVDLTPPYKIIFDMEKRMQQNQECISKSCDLDEVESTFMDPIFNNIVVKFQESAEMVISQYLARGCPNNMQIEKVSFELALAEKIKLPQSFPNPENVFLSFESRQELIIASYEDAIDDNADIKAETISSNVESPPHGSLDSGYTSMTSPLSGDPEYKSAAGNKSFDQADRPLRLSDVQVLKMFHNYSKCELLQEPRLKLDQISDAENGNSNPGCSYNQEKE